MEEISERSKEEIVHFSSELISYLTDPIFRLECDERAYTATAGNISGLEAISQCLRNRLDRAGL